MANFTQPLDLQTLLVNNLAGGYTLFFFIAMLVIAILGARFRMPNVVLAGMFVVFVVLMGTTSNVGEGVIKGILLIVLVGLGIFIGRTLTKISDR